MFDVSESLQGVFQGLKDTQGLDGEKKYRSDDVHRLAQYLVCRNYGNPCLELSYLCWAIVQHSTVSGEQGSKLLSFFWVDECIKPRRVRAAFAEPWQDTSQNHSITLAEQTLDINIRGNLFQISPTRVGVLAALLDFVATIDPKIVYSLESALLYGDEKQVKQQASALQKLIYHFIAEHLPTAQAQNKFRVITQWLTENEMCAETLCDDALLRFWQAQCVACPVEGFVKYTSAMDECLSYLNASKAAQAQMQSQNALSIGSDTDAGEIAADTLFASLFEELSVKYDYGALAQTPKCLTQSQSKQLNLLAYFAPFQSRFLRTLLRYQVFGYWQGVLIQANRNKTEIAEKLQHPDVLDYHDCSQELESLQDVMADAALCLTYVFSASGSLHWVGLNHLLADISLPEPILERIQADVLTTCHDADQDFSNVISEISLQFAEIRDLFHKAERAFKANNKAGFKTLPDIALLDEYTESAHLLQQSHQLLASTIKRLQPLKLTFSENFASDLCIFQQTMKQLYGGANAT
ncbi:hypothetical protein [Planctobacterium marinum]|uniref:Uncharacterized protein n=1 Tax=Planctobacterium marinum TaxID=1631968 RepID=A0AA48HV03_9ALTE|nr:hypothetical protein MACH26_18940 [Planctobacterium marinum]